MTEMTILLQRVEGKSVKVGQKVRVTGGKAWWTVDFKGVDVVVLKRGSQTKKLSPVEKFLQEPFANIEGVK